MTQLLSSFPVGISNFRIFRLNIAMIMLDWRSICHSNTKSDEIVVVWKPPSLGLSKFNLDIRSLRNHVIGESLLKFIQGGNGRPK